MAPILKSRTLTKSLALTIAEIHSLHINGSQLEFAANHAAIQFDQTEHRSRSHVALLNAGYKIHLGRTMRHSRDAKRLHRALCLGYHQKVSRNSSAIRIAKFASSQDPNAGRLISVGGAVLIADFSRSRQLPVCAVIQYGSTSVSRAFVRTMRSRYRACASGVARGAVALRLRGPAILLINGELGGCLTSKIR